MGKVTMGTWSLQSTALLGCDDRMGGCMRGGVAARSTESDSAAACGWRLHDSIEVPQESDVVWWAVANQAADKGEWPHINIIIIVVVIVIGSSAHQQQ